MLTKYLFVFGILVSGCDGQCDEFYKSMPRDGTPIEVYIDPAVRVDHGVIGIGIGLWSTVGVQVRYTVAKPAATETTRVEIYRMDETWSTELAGSAGLARTERSAQGTIFLRDDNGWHTVAHEFGHVLGLDHTTGACDVMSPVFCEGPYTLTDNDLAEFARTESCNQATGP